MKTYLALGDSYTIGELVQPLENFPGQLVNLLRGQQLSIAEPVIIAKTGWTTDELQAAIEEAAITETFDLVTLLIGVNNQYRGRPFDEYKIQFENLLQTAIHFANNQPAHVFVLSIPDWGVTPFAEGRDTDDIAIQIDLFNNAAETICNLYHVCFIDITASQRKDVRDAGFLAPDGLHPAAKEYAKWALVLSEKIINQFTNAANGI